MRKLFIIFMAAMLTVSIAGAKEITFNLEWDANTETDMAGYTLYLRLDGQSYDYNNPALVIPCTIQGGGCVPTTGQVVFDAPDDIASVYHVVARAYDSGDPVLFSEDSNEVSRSVDLRPLPVAGDFVGVYNESEETIDLTWTQEQAARVEKWIVNYGSIDGGPYPDVYEVENTGQTSYVASIPIVAPPGQLTVKYFVIHSEAEWDIVSPMTGQIAITIDKTEPPAAVINLRFEVVE